MRILKRNLAFMLAMIMALSLTAFAGYEDYSDVNELTYVEAVDVLTELGIVEGSDGALLPTGNLTRAQAAKLIAYTMLGKKAADALQAEVAPFVDVPTYHWAAGYVEYCADQGIIGGMGDGTYAPEANVTGSQYAKMLLCAVGYGEKGEFTGASWDSTVNSMATKLGVFDGNLDVVFANAVTREEAFLYTFNALTKVMEVTYSADADEYYAGTVFNSIKGFDAKETLGYKLYDLKTKAATDVFGRDSYNWYKGSKKIAGMYHEAPDAVYTTEVKSGTIFADLDLDNNTVATLIDNGVEKSFQVKKNSKTVVPGSDNGVVIEAYVDADMNVTLIKIDTYLAKVTDILDEDITMTVYGVDNQPKMPIEVDMDLVEKQYVLVTIVDDEIQTVAEVENVEGNLDANGINSNYHKMSGTKYSHSAHLDRNSEEAYKLPADEKYTKADMIMMLDEYGYMIGLKPVSEAEQLDGYVLVTASEFEVGGLATAGKAVVEVLHLDGTGYEVLNLDTKREKVGDDRVTKFLNEEGAWEVLANTCAIEYGFYGYYMTEDGEIVLKTLNADKNAEILCKTRFVGADDGAFVWGTNDYSFIEATGKQEIKFGANKVDLVLDNDTVLNLVTANGVETVEGYKNIKINEKDVDALVIFKDRVVEEIYVIDGSLVDKDLYAYYNDGEIEKIGSKYYVPMYLNGELQYFTWDMTKWDLDTMKALEDGVYKIELEGSKIVAMTEKMLESTKTKVLSTASNDKSFNVAGETNVTYADGAKVYDLTKAGVEIEKVVKGDTIVYFNNKNEDGKVATHIWVVSHNSKEQDKNDTIVTVGKAYNLVEGGANYLVLKTNAKLDNAQVIVEKRVGDQWAQVDVVDVPAANFNATEGYQWIAEAGLINGTDAFRFYFTVGGENATLVLNTATGLTYIAQ